MSRRARAVPTSLITLARRQEDLLSADQCDEAGVTRGRREALVRIGTWRRPTRGVFDVDPGRDRVRDADHRRRRAAWLGMLAYGEDAVAVGACALALHGASGLPLDVTPEVGFPLLRRAHHRAGIRVRYIDQIETIRYGSRSVAQLLPALAQALPELPRRNAVAVLDDLMRRGLLSDAGANTVLDRLAGRRGSRRVRELVALVDRRSESPLESFARLECVDAGVPPDEVQVEIRDDRGRFVARGDLGWRLGGGRWLIVEIDGREVHEAPAALLRDRTRQNALLATGRVDLLRFTSSDLAVVGTVSSAVRAALRAEGPTSSLLRMPSGL